MRHLTTGKTLLLGLALLLPAAAIGAEPIERELHVIVEFDAEQTWVSKTEEYGHQHSEATTHQRYELRTRLRAEPELHSRNILDLDKETRLKAKTIWLARQAIEEMKASGGEVVIPTTPEQKQAMSRKMQEQQVECGGDMACRQAVQMRFAKLFAAAEYPEALEEDEPGTGRYRYFEPYEGCPVETRVTMEMTTEGVHYSERTQELVPFKETRSADTVNGETEVPLCERYLAVIDAKDDRDPMYIENFYLPSAVGETVRTEQSDPVWTERKTESQPQNAFVLGWVTQQLRHGPTSGSAEETISLHGPLNGISRQSGNYTHGEAHVKMTWRFEKVDEDAQ
ncbi:hypothetical protein [Salinisphaera sp. PC39]|uniref:hypothetical protein n=1 Tax=Salinisphaera sp. PC39 TaxID=1304156 RepID=UPI00333ECF71